MNAGTILADGDPHTVMSDRTVIEAYLGGGHRMSLLSINALDIRHGLLQAVREVSFQVEQGETVALIGANGAGKTTLLRGIAGAHRPAHGQIRLDGT